MINNSRSEDRRDRTRKSVTSLERTAPKSKSRFGKQPSRYEQLKHTVKTWVQDRFAVADALKEIRDEKLYQKDYATFEECCEAEFGLKHSQAYGLIAASNLKESLPPQLRTSLKNEGQARALAEVKESSRPAVLKRVAKSGTVTAKAITEATKPRERKGPVVIDVEPEPIKASAAKHCPTCTCG